MEDGNFRLSTRFLEHHPITSPPATQKEVTYSIVLTPNFAFKNSSWKPLGSFSSFQFSHSVLFDSLRPCGLQHSRLPYHPSPTPRAYSVSCPLSQWCHPTISSSVEFGVVFFFSRSHSFTFLGSLSLLQALMFLFVWLQCVSSTATWVQQHSLSSLSFLTLIICVLSLPLVFRAGVKAVD